MPPRLGARRVWIVDPLDGTREFGEAGRADWAVHVALVVGGAVVRPQSRLPARDSRSTAARPRLRPRTAARGIVVSRTRPPAVAENWPSHSAASW